MTPNTTPAFAGLLDPTFQRPSGVTSGPAGPAGNWPPPMNPLDCARGSRWLPGLSPSMLCWVIGSRAHHHWRRSDAFDDLPDYDRNADADCEEREVPAPLGRKLLRPEQADGSEDDREPTESKGKHEADDLDPAERDREHPAHDA